MNPTFENKEPNTLYTKSTLSLKLPIFLVSDSSYLFIQSQACLDVSLHCGRICGTDTEYLVEVAFIGANHHFGNERMQSVGQCRFIQHFYALITRPLKTHYREQSQQPTESRLVCSLCDRSRIPIRKALGYLPFWQQREN